MPIITISRQFGAGGRTLGQRVAKALNFRFVDEDILEQVAAEAGVTKNWVQHVEKEAGYRLMRVLTRLVPSSFMERHLGSSGADFHEKKYVGFLVQVMNKIAENDNAVILGRGSQFILAEHPRAIKVLLVAERQDRINFMVQHYHMEPGRAETAIAGQERKRARFLRHFHPGEANEASLYHLVMNISLIPLQVAERQICDLVQEVVV